MPQPFPQSTVQTQRALCAISVACPDKLTPCFEALYHAFWVEGQTPIGKPEVFGPVLSKILGEQQCKEILQKASEPEAKKMLSDNTNSAIEEGAFGLPWFITTNAQGEKEGFWGFDHLGQVVDHLGLEREGEGYKAML